MSPMLEFSCAESRMHPASTLDKHVRGSFGIRTLFRRPFIFRLRCYSRPAMRQASSQARARSKLYRARVIRSSHVMHG